MASTDHIAWRLNGTKRRVAFLFDASAADGNAGWMQCGVAGEWRGNRQGAFKLTGAMFDQMISTFQKNGVDLMVDWNHAAAKSKATQEEGKAAGWVKKLEKRVVDGVAQLWSWVEWTADAADAIRAKHYRYCSPWIDFEMPDRVSGEEGVALVNVALTNIPFLPGMQALQLSRGVEMADENVTEEQITEETPIMASAISEIATAFGVSEEEAGAWLVENIDKIKAMRGDAATESTAVSASAIDPVKATVVALSADVARLVSNDKKREAAAIAAEVDGYIQSGHILASHRALALDTFTSNRPLAEATYLKGGKAVPVNDPQAKLTSERSPEAAKQAQLSALPVRAQRAYAALLPMYKGNHEEALKRAQHPRYQD